MNQISNEQIKQYFKQIKLLLPIYSKEEKEFIKDLQKAVQDYIEEHPACTYEDILDRFEEPADVVHNYISSLDQYQLCKRISLKKTVRTAVIIIVVAVIAALSIRTALFYKAYKASHDTIITHERVVIE